MNQLVQDIKLRSKAENDHLLYVAVDYEKGHEEVSYSKLWRKMNDYAAVMEQHGITQGKKVIIFCDNTLDNVYTIYACLLRGIVFSLLPIPVDEGKINRFYSVVKSCSPEAVLVAEHIYDAFRERMGELETTGIEFIHDWSNTLNENIEYEPYDTQEDDIVYLQYSSGSTNEPKGIMTEYRNVMAHLKDFQYIVPTCQRSITSWVPFFHNVGLILILLKSVYSDRVAYIIRTTDFMRNPLIWMKTISDFRVEITVAPNSAYDLCSRIIDKKVASQFDLSCLKNIGNGTEMVLPDTIESFCDLFNLKPELFTLSYGLAENVCVASGEHDGYEKRNIDYEAYKNNRFKVLTDEELKTHTYKSVMSNGRPVRCLKMVVVDLNEPSKEVSDSCQIGEVCIQGASVTRGYLGSIEENKNFHHKIDGYEGDFLRTGDMGVLYEGLLYVTGRIKEMIIINGHNIYPADIQHTIYRSVPELANHTVCSFSYAVDGRERVVIIVEVGNNEKLDYESLSERITSKVTEVFEVSPHDVLFVKQASLVRTDNGKLRIHKIRRDYKTGCLQLLYSSFSSLTAGDDNTHTNKAVCSDIVEQGVRDIFDKILHTADVELDKSFLELGGNSFDTLELIVALEHNFDVKFDAREILLAPSVCGIANQIKSKIKNGTAAFKAVDLYKECKLAEDIQINGEYDKKPSECSVFFLTGSTGFLGAYLIADILKNCNAEDKKIYCHCRADSIDKGMERIKKNMQHYECWDNSFEQYIYPVTGDLTKPHLGIEDYTYEKLVQEVEVVYHNGALLNFMFPYEYLKKSNVYGTEECLRFACEAKPKYFNYISSFSVYDNPSHFGKHVYEDDGLESSDGYFLGYSQTKWVAEKLVKTAQSRGLKTVIFRPGDITGAKDNGIWNLGDLISRILVSSIQTGKMPNADLKLYITPVDYVSNAVVYISKNENAYEKAFNLVNKNIASAIETKNIMEECGYPIEIIPYIQWYKELKESTPEKNVLNILSCLFDENSEKEDGIIRRYSELQPIFDTSNTDEFLKDSGITCPPVDKGLLGSYINYFVKQGFITKK